MLAPFIVLKQANCLTQQLQHHLCCSLIAFSMPRGRGRLLFHCIRAIAFSDYLLRNAVILRKFLPTNLPTGNCDSLQRLAAPLRM